MDHVGFCTYDSIYRAKEIFGVKNMIIVTQKYHLIREMLARCKNFFKCIFRMKPKYLGERVSLKQS